ncbi:interleukin-2 receptor subunit beta-like [Paroedura picta]|uniref:interleukin-2 receptor subunit beta-like n=1 Tax=Paroedura picta TaxID=143630 RepID=UPI004056A2A0
MTGRQKTITQPNEGQGNLLLNSAVMKTSSPVLLYTLSLVLVSKAWLGSSNLTCVYDSVETVTCNWTQSQNATEAQCTLIGHVESQHQSSHFQGNPPQTCNLQGIGTTIRSCKLIFDEETYALTVTDSIRLVVPCHTGENERRESSYMKPFENLTIAHAVPVGIACYYN